MGHGYIWAGLTTLIEFALFIMETLLRKNSFGLDVLRPIILGFNTNVTLILVVISKD